MTQTPTHQPASAHNASGASGGVSANVTVLSSAAPDGEDPATRAARARHTNAHRAAQALHHHTRATGNHADDMQQALVELLSDLHHLCHTCDLDLTPLYQAATFVYDREAHAA